MLAKKTRKILSLALVLVMVISMFPMFAMADEEPPAGNPLTPVSRTYEDGQIELTKTAARTGDDEWQVTVTAEIGDITIKQQPLEVVFVLDTSGSMGLCTAEAHTHDAQCGSLDEPNHNEHEHTEDCDECTKEQHEHTEACCILHAHNADCFICDCEEGEHLPECEPVLNCFIESDHVHGTDCYCGVEAHSHNADCGPCELEVHNHTSDCNWACGKVAHKHNSATVTPGTDPTSTSGTCYGMAGYSGERRLNAAIGAINDMVGSLPADTIISYVSFSSEKKQQTHPGGYGESVAASGYTYITNGVDLGIKQFVEGSASQKILILVSDGEATDGKYSSEDLVDFGLDGGTVYTVGFTYVNASLAGMVKGNGAYMTAKDTSALNSVLSTISSQITAMIVDPMGPWVEYNPDSVEFVSSLNTVDGVFNTNNDKEILWLPAAGVTTISGETISYTYTVTLNEDAIMDAGVYFDVRTLLNGTTYLKYALVEDGETIETNEVEFNVPKATYGVGTLEVEYVNAVPEDIGSKLSANQPKFQKKALIVDWEGKPKAFSDFAYNNSFAYETIAKDFETEYKYKNTTYAIWNAEEEEWEALTERPDSGDTVETKAYKIIHHYVEARIPQPGDLVITKVVAGVGEDDIDLIPETYTFTITPVGGGEPETVIVNMTGTNGSSSPYEGLEPGSYTVAEVLTNVNIPGYTLTAPGSQIIEITDDDSVSIVFTNTYTPDNPFIPIIFPDPSNPIDIPDPSDPLTDIPDPSDPLTDIPDGDDPLTDIPDDLDPLGDAPKTGDGNNIFLLLSIMISCAFGLVIINLPRKKRNEG